MCGIGGIVFRDREQEPSAALLDAMQRAIAHRGPDAHGIWSQPGAGLVHRRLSIIDVAGGRQPLENEDGAVRIVFNGEVYNHHPLRDDLIKRGHVFQTRSDTEAILHLYEEEGERCPERLRGMFAFAIWNAHTRELLLARDRTGKKPMFYAELPGGGLAFASEMKSLLAIPGLSRELDLEAVQDYLGLQYVPAPASIFRAIRKLPPGHTLRWRDGQLDQPRRYWQLEYEPKLTLSVDEAAERLRAELDEAVRVRLESEVPLGCLLSGGVDSSAVVALMRRHATGPLRTFSIGFEEESHNELPYARIVAERFSTQHEEFIVRPDAAAVLPQVVWHLDEPMADASALPTWYVSQITRRGVTVALNGDGGDESFAGYTRYKGHPVVDRYGRIPAVLRRAVLGPAARALSAALPGNAKLDQLAWLNAFTLMPPAEHYAQYMLIFRNDKRRALCAGGPLEAAALARDPMAWLGTLYHRAGATHAVDRQLQCDVAGYLPGDLLVKMDRMTMAHGLEGRSPFLDHQVMEFAARLPVEYKLREGTLKWLLKRALEPVLPREILYRPKQGFGVPLKDWFRGAMRELAHDLLLGARARQRGYFNPAFVERMLHQHTSGAANHQHRLWLLLSFEVWCRTYLDRAEPWQGPASLT